MGTRFSDVIDGFGPSNIEGIVNLLGGRGRGGGVRRLAEMFAAETGKTVSSQQRAIQRALKTGKTPRTVPDAAIRQVRADQFTNQVKGASIIDIGRISLTYNQDGPGRPGRDEGTRSPGRLVAGDRLRGQLEDAADLYRAGEDDRAHDAAAEALLGAYGARTGRPDTMGGLGIGDFRDGIIPY